MRQPAGCARGLACASRNFETYVGLVIVLFGLVAVTLLVVALLDLVLARSGAVLALVVVAVVVLVVPAGAADEGGVHVDVVEDREADVVRPYTLSLVEDDGDALNVGGDAASLTKPQPPVAEGGHRQLAAHHCLSAGGGGDLESRC